MKTRCKDMGLKDPFFSVIIPAYNRKRLIKITVESVLAQTFKDFELIIVDDGSTDGTAEVAEQISGRIQVLRQQNSGPGAARNRGIAEARGTYICFLDSDDLWFPWTLQTYHDAILREQHPAFVSGESMFFEVEDQVSSVSRQNFECRAFNDYFSTSHEPLWIGTCAVAIRADVLRSVGAFRMHSLNAEDSDLWMRMGTAKEFVHIRSPEVFAYRRHEGSAISNISKTVAGIRELVRTEKQNGYPGGKERKIERLRILTRHTRPVVIELAKRGQSRKFFGLYFDTFLWNLRLGRFRFLTGALLVLGRGMLRKKPSQENSGDSAGKFSDQLRTSKAK